MIPVVAIGFVLIGGLLLWFVIGSRGLWWLKLPLIVLTCVFTFAVWRALDSFTGWPTSTAPPARALLLSSEVDEPDAIYVWLLTPARPGVLEYRPGATEPRAFRLPYTRTLHHQIDRAQGMARRGQPVELRRVSGQEGEGPSRGRFRVFPLPPSQQAVKKSR